MIHRHAGHKLGLVPHQRKALLRNLSLALLENESIRTTRARASALVWYAERFVTLAKSGEESSRRRIFQILGTTQSNNGENRVTKAVANLYDSVVPRFKDRNGGYTQTILLANRRPGDNAEMVIFQYLPGAEGDKKAKAPTDKKKPATKKAAPADKPVEKKAKAKAEAEDKHQHHAKGKTKEPEDKPTKKK